MKRDWRRAPREAVSRNDHHNWLAGRRGAADRLCLYLAPRWVRRQNWPQRWLSKARP